jgi:hypothetical protein
MANSFGVSYRDFLDHYENEFLRIMHKESEIAWNLTSLVIYLKDLNIQLAQEQQLISLKKQVKL